MYLKRKRTGKVKACGCADGRPQGEYITKEESSVPTVLTNSLILVCLVAVIQRRKVAVGDIAGAFLQSDYPPDHEDYLRLEGLMVDILVQIVPEYGNYVFTTKRGTKLLSARINKGIYGTLLGAILFYNKLSKFLTDVLEFKMKPYDKCTFNKVINDHHCTIQFHIDDLMVTHHDKQVIDDIFERQDEQFGTVRKMSVKHGPVVEYLGMFIGFSEDGRVIFLTIDYLEDILAECADYDMDGTAVWPVHEDLFKIDENAQKLSSIDGDSIFWYYP